MESAEHKNPYAILNFGESFFTIFSPHSLSDEKLRVLPLGVDYGSDHPKACVDYCSSTVIKGSFNQGYTNKTVYSAKNVKHYYVVKTNEGKKIMVSMVRVIADIIEHTLNILYNDYEYSCRRYYVDEDDYYLIDIDLYVIFPSCLNADKIKHYCECIFTKAKMSGIKFGAINFINQCYALELTIKDVFNLNCPVISFDCYESWISSRINGKLSNFFDINYMNLDKIQGVVDEVKKCQSPNHAIIITKNYKLFDMLTKIFTTMIFVFIPKPELLLNFINCQNLKPNSVDTKHYPDVFRWTKIYNALEKDK